MTIIWKGRVRILTVNGELHQKMCCKIFMTLNRLGIYLLYQVLKRVVTITWIVKCELYQIPLCLLPLIKLMCTLVFAERNTYSDIQDRLYLSIHIENTHYIVIDMLYLSIHIENTHYIVIDNTHYIVQSFSLSNSHISCSTLYNHLRHR